LYGQQEVTMHGVFSKSALRGDARLAVLGMAACLLPACSGTPGTPASPTAAATPAAGARSADSCINVFAEGSGALGFVQLPNGVQGPGADWFPVSLAHVNGEMASVLLSETISGNGGAAHWVLQHAFRTSDGDYFITEDRAVCAPAG